MKRLEPKLCRRKPDPQILEAARTAGLHPVAARVLAQRLPTGTEPAKLLAPPISRLDSPSTLPDIDKAARRIVLAILSGEQIGVNTDFDCDGISSTYVLLTALTRFFGHPAEKTSFFIGHRLTDGHGLTDSVAERILSLETRPSLLITADHGSSDELRICMLLRHGIDTIVTDHHGIPTEGPPASAYAVVSPARADSAYPDPTICGCMVAFLLMHRVRSLLIEQNHLGGEIPPLNPLLGSVAAATVADCVDLRSVNNRAVVTAGLKLINANISPAWRVFRQHACKPDQAVTAETLAFVLGPAVNSRSRVAEPGAAVRFFMSTTDVEAAHWWKQLVASNDHRKDIQRRMTEHALKAVWPQVEEGRCSIVYFGGETFSAGVHGIVASKLVEAYGRVTMLLSPVEGDPEMITGSCRTIEGCDVKAALDAVAQTHPSLLVGYGGHRGAGGCRLRLADLETFSKAFEAAVRTQIAPEHVGPRLYSDGTLPPDLINLETIAAIDTLEPYGRQFDRPLFDGSFTVRELRVIGDGSHLSLVLEAGGITVRAIWFSAMPLGTDPPVRQGQTIRALYELRANHYNGRSSAQLMVRHVRPLEETADVPTVQEAQKRIA